MQRTYIMKNKIQTQITKEITEDNGMSEDTQWREAYF